LVAGTARPFFNEIKSFLTVERPRVVFDLSAVARIDSAGLQMLLNSMEEAMKRNGDLKLASVSTTAITVLRLTRVDSLFEIFEHAAEAVDSFRQLPIPMFAATPEWVQTPTA
jgi:anti-anti-sigma factor